MNTSQVQQQIPPAHHLWPPITEEQRQQDILIRTEQAANRSLTDEALKEGGRAWISGSAGSTSQIHNVPGDGGLQE